MYKGPCASAAEVGGKKPQTMAIPSRQPKRLIQGSYQFGARKAPHISWSQFDPFSKRLVTQVEVGRIRELLPYDILER